MSWARIKPTVHGADSLLQEQTWLGASESKALHEPFIGVFCFRRTFQPTVISFNLKYMFQQSKVLLLILVTLDMVVTRNFFKFLLSCQTHVLQWQGLTIRSMGKWGKGWCVDQWWKGRFNIYSVCRQVVSRWLSPHCSSMGNPRCGNVCMGWWYSYFNPELSDKSSFQVINLVNPTPCSASWDRHELLPGGSPIPCERLKEQWQKKTTSPWKPMQLSQLTPSWA